MDNLSTCDTKTIQTKGMRQAEPCCLLGSSIAAGPILNVIKALVVGR